MASRGYCSQCANSWQPQPDCEADSLIPDSPIGTMRGPTSPAGGTFLVSPPPFFSPLPQCNVAFNASPRAWLNESIPTDPYSDLSFASRSPAPSPQSASASFPYFQYPSDMSAASSPGRFCGYPTTGTTPTNFVLQSPPPGRRAQAPFPALDATFPVSPVLRTSDSLPMPGSFPGMAPGFSSTPTATSSPVPLQLSPIGGRSMASNTSVPCPCEDAPDQQWRILSDYSYQSPSSYRMERTYDIFPDTPSLSPSQERFQNCLFQFPQSPQHFDFFIPSKFSGYPTTGTTPTNFVLQPPPLGWKANTTPYLMLKYPYSPISVGDFTLPWEQSASSSAQTPVPFPGFSPVPSPSPAAAPSPVSSPAPSLRRVNYTLFEYPSYLSAMSSPGSFSGYPVTGTTPTSFYLQPPPPGRWAQAQAQSLGGFSPGILPGLTSSPVAASSPVGRTSMAATTSGPCPCANAPDLALCPSAPNAPAVGPAQTPVPLTFPPIDLEEVFNTCIFQFPPYFIYYGSPGRFYFYPPTGGTPKNFVLQKPPLGKKARQLWDQQSPYTPSFTYSDNPYFDYYPEHTIATPTGPASAPPSLASVTPPVKFEWPSLGSPPIPLSAFTVGTLPSLPSSPVAASSACRAVTPPLSPNATQLEDLWALLDYRWNPQPTACPMPSSPWQADSIYFKQYVSPNANACASSNGSPWSANPIYFQPYVSPSTSPVSPSQERFQNCIFRFPQPPLDWDACTPSEFAGYPTTGTTPKRFALQPPPPGRRAIGGTPPSPAPTTNQPSTTPAPNNATEKGQSSQ